jgi:UDP-N-acetyl-2-amino-2-deoxyglucuronate dehydrogenase
MLTWIFGDVTENEVKIHEADQASGFLKLEKANVNWHLSINADHLPTQATASGKRTYRSITVDGDEVEFSEGFTDLHTRSYEQILAGNGFGLEDARRSIGIAQGIRKQI